MTDEMIQEAGVPFTGVVFPTAKTACRVTKTGRIGVLGTSATIKSGSYARAIQKIDPKIQVFAQACPLFVPLVENGFASPDNPVAELVAQEYLADLQKHKPDTLILGCTHYPLIAPAIQKIMGPEVTLIDSGKEAAGFVKEYLKLRHMLAQHGEGTVRYFVSADTEDFDQIAMRFLGHPLEQPVEHIEVDRLCEIQKG